MIVACLASTMHYLMGPASLVTAILKVPMVSTFKFFKYFQNYLNNGEGDRRRVRVGVELLSDRPMASRLFNITANKKIGKHLPSH